MHHRSWKEVADYSRSDQAEDDLNQSGNYPHSQDHAIGLKVNCEIDPTGIAKLRNRTENNHDHSGCRPFDGQLGIAHENRKD